MTDVFSISTNEDAVYVTLAGCRRLKNLDQEQERAVCYHTRRDCRASRSDYKDDREHHTNSGVNALKLSDLRLKGANVRPCKMCS